jgi:carboxymethylenebutenolidase
MQTEKSAGWYDAEGLRTYLSPPAAGPKQRRPAARDAGVLMLPMITGIGEQLRDWADEVADTTGTTVLVWDPWHGPSSDNTPLSELRERLSRLDDATALDEIGRLVNHMHFTLGLKRITVIGWCLGGRYALLAGARHPEFGGVVAMHPTLPVTESGRGEFDAAAAAADIATAVMVHYPGRDHIVPFESFRRLQASLVARSDAASFVAVHPRAHHGFSDRKNHSDPANAEAFRLAWPQVLAFLDSTTGTLDQDARTTEGTRNA